CFFLRFCHDDVVSKTERLREGETERGDKDESPSVTLSLRLSVLPILPPCPWPAFGRLLHSRPRSRRVHERIRRHLPLFPAVKGWLRACIPPDRGSIPSFPSTFTCLERWILRTASRSSGGWPMMQLRGATDES